MSFRWDCMFWQVVCEGGDLGATSVGSFRALGALELSSFRALDVFSIPPYRHTAIRAMTHDSAVLLPAPHSSDSTKTRSALPIEFQEHLKMADGGSESQDAAPQTNYDLRDLSHAPPTISSLLQQLFSIYSPFI